MHSAKALVLAVTLVLFGLLVDRSPLQAETLTSETSLFDGLEWRFAGPMRGGRTNAVVGHPTQRQIFFAGYTGGGIWKTEDAGLTWRNVSDGFLNVGSIGAIAIAESAPDTIYAGTGEHALRGDVSHGDGVYKSTDGGESWSHIGLAQTMQIAEILVHPSNPDIVYVAALGAFTGPSAERGVFRSMDGGETWEKILFVSQDAGAIEIELSRTDPNLLFAATWDVRRFPWGIRSAGPGSQIFRSRDGGDTWVNISERPGLPTGIKEKIGLGLSDAKPGRIYALVSGESDRGVFLSDDYGETWRRTANDKKLLARTFYFNHMTADPQAPDTIYVLNDRLWRSTDAGQSFAALPHGHADHHDMWIDPNDNRRIIDGTDGGAEISFNQGATWSTLFNQPTGQFYTLTIDEAEPYNLIGAQQDWSTIVLPSRHRRSRTGQPNFYDVAYSEAGRVAIDQRDPDILYISDHHWLLRYNRRDGGAQYAGPRDETNYGWGTADIKYRFNWTFPIFASVHDDTTLYTASQYLHRSRDGGQTWEEISPDLTRADPDTLERTPLPGREFASNPEYWGPLTRDSNGDHWFATLYTLAESPLQQGVIWTGSDDGFVQLTRDDGKSWSNVTPPTMPDYAMVTRIEASPHALGTAYVTASAYKYGNLQTLVFRTRDFGANWSLVTTGLPRDQIMRAIAADPEVPGLLYAGGESGVFLSMDDGDSWHSVQLNLPRVPVYDMKIKGNDLALATHGRGFWVMDDLSVIRQEATQAAGSGPRLYKPDPVRRWSGRWASGSLNEPPGLTLRYRLPDDAQAVGVEILSGDGELIRRFGADDGVTAYVGLNAFRWDLRYPNAQRVPGVVTRGSQQVGPVAPPGDYGAVLIVNEDRYEVPVFIERDPRIDASKDDLREQFAFLAEIRDRLDAMNKAVITIRAIRGQANKRFDGEDLSEDARSQLDRLIVPLTRIEQAFVQVNAQARKDLHANPVALNDKLYRLSNFASRVEAAPTPTQRAMLDEFAEEIVRNLAQYEELIAQPLERLNQTLTDLEKEPITLPELTPEEGEEISATMAI
ncbi:MAG: glycosyl hydrolase [Pseudomonadota bacterium]